MRLTVYAGIVVFAATAHAQPNPTPPTEPTPPEPSPTTPAPPAPTTPAPTTSPEPAPAPAPAPVPAGPPPPSAQPVPAKPAEKIVVKTVGRVQLSVGVDPINQGDVPEFLAPPDAFKREWNVSTMLNAALGAMFVVPKPVGGFTIRGAFGVGVYIRRIFAEAQGFLELDHEKQGLKIRAGKMIGPTVSTYFPGSFQYPGFYGNLAYALTGVKVSKTFEPVLAEIAVGRPEFPFIPIEITPTPQSNPPFPFVEGRIAYRNTKFMGELPGSALGAPVKTPLTVSVSGAYGKMRVGPGEKAAVLAVAPMAVDPKIEDLNSYLISAEVVVPIEGFVVLSEVYAGRGTNLYLGGFRQRPRVDPMTGLHKVLGTGGGYLQVSYAPQPEWIIVALAGLDRVVSGLNHGVAVEPTPRIEENRLFLGSVSRTFGPGLKVGVQAHYLKTEYRDLGEGDMFGFIGDIVMSF